MKAPKLDPLPITERTGTTAGLAKDPMSRDDAIELATDTLDVLGNAEPSPELAAEELTLRTSLARALMAVRGYNADVEEAFKRALALTTEADSTAQRFPVLRALASYYIGTSEPGRALEIGKRLLELGEEEQDSSILVEGNYVVGSSLLFVDVDKLMIDGDVGELVDAFLIDLEPLGMAQVLADIVLQLVRGYDGLHASFLH